MTSETPKGHAAEVFVTFLKLGLTSFGGPVAHLGYFRQELVERRKWLTDAAYADLVVLCQFLPGPASSQAGFALGLMRAGWVGAVAAFVAFTLPSALALVIFAALVDQISGPIGAGALHGLKLVAVAVVAQAVWGMAGNLCPDRPRVGIAVGAVVLLAVLPGSLGMIGAILAGALAGYLLLPDAQALTTDAPDAPVSRRVGALALGVFLVLLLVLPLVAGSGGALALVDGFYRAGALVFGGGHVVLPLLQAEVVTPGWVTSEAFLAGYGAAQAVPGPLFTFAAYLGAVHSGAGNSVTGAALALGAVFLPGFLILIGVLPFWNLLRKLAPARRLMQGANAAVVGILLAALHDPVFTTSVKGGADFALALACLLLLTVWKLSPLAVVGIGALCGVGLALAG